MQCSEEQLAAINAVVENKSNKIIAVDARSGSGKEQPITAIVKTPNGDRQIGDLIPGDYVYGVNGKPTKVLGVYPQGLKNTYEVTFMDNSKTRCGLHHNWSINTIGMRNRNKFIVKTTEELIKQGCKTNKNVSRFKIPLCNPVEYPKKKLKVDPYILGVFLGNGTYTTSTPGISAHVDDQFILDKVKRLLKKEHNINITKEPRFTSKNGVQLMLTTQDYKSPPPVGALFDSIGVNSNNRIIPEEYFYGSVSQRLKLLQGLLDSDGSIRKNRTSFSNTNLNLINGVIRLVQSLGGTARLQAPDKRKKPYCYSISIRMFINPFSLPRKADQWKVSTKNPPCRYIKSIEKLDIVEEHVCIMVEAKDSLYLTDEYIVTHNTYLCDSLIKAYKPIRGYYTAFNRAIVQNSAERFKGAIRAKTMHALAYEYIKPSQQIEELNFNTIKENLTYIEKSLIIESINKFYTSNYTDMYDFLKDHKEYGCIKHYFLNYIDKMFNGIIPPTFNYLLKCFHIMLKDKEITTDFDLFIFDECADMVPVTLEIFKLLQADQKVVLGDKYQNIYSFMGTVNAFEELDNLDIYPLTKSFRCSPAIAEQVEEFGIKYLTPDFKFTGNPDLIPCTDPISVHLSRSNAALILRAYRLLLEGKTFTINRAHTDLFKLPLAIYDAANGKKIRDKKLKYLEKEYKRYMQKWLDTASVFEDYYEHLEFNVDDPPVRASVNLLRVLKKVGANIRDVEKMLSKVYPNPNRIISTVHTFKGLEGDTVILNGDLIDNVESAKNLRQVYLDKGVTKIPKIVQEEFNIYYTAMSRARFELHNHCVD